jgi:hypothetical protein
MTTSPAHRSRRRPLVVATVMSAAVLVPAGTAAATWHTSQRTLIDFRDVCRDGIRFGGAVRDGAGPATGPYKNRAVAVQPPPSSWKEWKNKKGEVMDTRIEIPVHPGEVITPDESEPIKVSHEGELRKRYRKRPLKLAPVALNLEHGNVDSNMNTEMVTDCFLYAPIDVEPGTSANKLPFGRGQVSVAALATSIMAADGLTPSDFRFGPKQAAATSSERRDVNGDDRTDLLLHFSSASAGLECSTTSVLLKGKTASGGIYEGTDKVALQGC